MDIVFMFILLFLPFKSSSFVENTNKLLTHEDNGDNDDIADETPEMTDPKGIRLLLCYTNCNDQIIF